MPTAQNYHDVLRRNVREFQSHEGLLRINHRVRGIDAADSKGVLSIPFLATVADYLARFSNPHRGVCATEADLDSLAQHAMHLRTADPVGYNEEERQRFYEGPVLQLVLRHGGVQFPFQLVRHTRAARSRLMWVELPATRSPPHGVSGFRFADRFRELYGCDFDGWLAALLYIWCQSRSGSPQLSIARLQADRDTHGVVLPGDPSLESTFRSVAADQATLRQLARSGEVPNRLFRAYDLNPLFIRPVFMPWGHTGGTKSEGIAPIPDLLLWPMAEGVYYTVKDSYPSPDNEFTRWVGWTLELYVEWMLNQPGSGTLEVVTEAQLQERYGSRRQQRKVPDLVALEDGAAICVECKAARWPRHALTSNDPEILDDAIKQVDRFIVKLADFASAVRANEPGLEPLSGRSLHALLVTLEPLWLLDSDAGRMYLRKRIGAALDSLEAKVDSWRIVSLDAMEAYLPRLMAGDGFHGLMAAREDGSSLEPLDAARLASCPLRQRAVDLLNAIVPAPVAGD